MDRELQDQLDALRCAYEAIYQPSERVRVAWLAAENAFEAFQRARTERERVLCCARAQDVIWVALQVMEEYSIQEMEREVWS
jgi:hypothetical protein